MKIITTTGTEVKITDTKCHAPHTSVTKRFSTTYAAEKFAKGFIKFRRGTRDFGNIIMTEKMKRKNTTILFSAEEYYQVEAYFKANPSR